MSHLSAALLAASLAVSTGCSSQPEPAAANRPVRITTVYDPTGQNPYVWEPMPPASASHMAGVRAVRDGKLYVAGGYGYHFANSDVVEAFDPTTSSWTQVGKLPYPISHAAGALDGSRIWMFGGILENNAGPTTSKGLVIDLDTGQSEPAPSLPEPRKCGGAAILGNRLYFASGVGPNAIPAQPDMWSLDLNDPTEWRTEPPIPRPRCHYGLLAFQGKLYALGGATEHGEPFGPWNDLGWVDIYDPKTGAWTQGPQMPRQVSHLEGGTFAVNQSIIVAGGRSLVDTVRDIWALDTETGKWRVIGLLPDRLSGANVAILGGHIVVSGGRVDREQPGPRTWMGPLTHFWPEIIHGSS